jgi:anti-sigma factor RsiW
MSDHVHDEALEDYAEGEIAPEARAPVEAHLQECAPCRASVEAIRNVRTALAALPEDVEPERDLLPEILARTERTASGSAGPAAHRAWAAWHMRAASVPRAVWAVAASLVFFLIGAAAFFALDRGGPVRVTRTKTLTVETAYAGEIGELTEALAARRATLRPETVKTIEDNLRIIDDAIARSRAALEQDPSSGDLLQLLSYTYETKIELLRRAAEIPD